MRRGEGYPEGRGGGLVGGDDGRGGDGWEQARQDRKSKGKAGMGKTEGKEQRGERD